MPDNITGPCLDREERIKNDTLQRFSECELESSQCSTEPGPAWGIREYPNSSDGP